MAEADEPPSALAVIVDLGVEWSRRPHKECAGLIEQLLLFLNAYHLHSATSTLLLLGAHSHSVTTLWPPNQNDEPATPSHPQQLRAAVASGMQRIAAHSKTPHDAGSDGDGDAPLLSAALSTALCRLQRVRRSRPKVDPRVLIVHASPDAHTQYLATMNCVFGAQKLGILIDAVLLGGGDDSMLLQQAAHLTGGLYFRPDATAQQALAQTLITCCLPGRYERQFLRPPPQGQPGTLALCNLTKKPVEMGHACSVCLSVFAHDNLSSCPVCGTRFALTMPAGQGRKKLKRPAAAAPAPASATQGAT